MVSFKGKLLRFWHPRTLENDQFEYMNSWNHLFSSHCVKIVQIRSYFCSVFSCIRIEYRKIRTRNNSVFGHFSRSARQSSPSRIIVVIKLLDFGINYSTTIILWKMFFSRNSTGNCNVITNQAYSCCIW